MRRLRQIGLAALAVGLCLVVALSAAPVASGHDAKQSGGRIAAPTGTWEGQTAGELMGEVWHRLLSLPAEENPWFGNGDPCFRLGRTGSVLYPANPRPERGCTVKQGTPVFVNGLFTECSSAEPPYSNDEAIQRRCALDNDLQVAASLVSIDGGRPVDVRDRRYGVFSPQRRVTLLPGNILEVPPQRATFTGHGWMAMIVELPPGHHAIRSESTWVDGSEPYIFTKYVNVIESPGGRTRTRHGEGKTR